MTVSELLGCSPELSGYEPRTYRNTMVSSDLVSYQVTIGESDLFISTDSDLSFTAEQNLREVRHIIEDHIRKEPAFVRALSPMKVNTTDAPLIVKMKQAAKAAGVGPMAAVAGAVAEEVGKTLRKYSQTVIVENGGDLYIHTAFERTIGIYAGASKLSHRLGLKLKAGATLGICTSAGSFGHSLSFGCADAALAVSRCAYTADAAATAIGNQVGSIDQIEQAVEYGKRITGIIGVIVIKQDRIGAWGDIELVQV